MDECNQRNRGNEAKVDDTYKRCMTGTKGTRNKGRQQDGKRSEKIGVARIIHKYNQKTQTNEDQN